MVHRAVDCRSDSRCRRLARVLLLLAHGRPLCSRVYCCYHANASARPMPDLVAAFGTPHTPLFPLQVAREGPQSETAQLFSAVRAQLDAVQADVLVVFDSDHLNTFFLDNWPTFSVGVAEQTSGPNDGTPGLA